MLFYNSPSLLELDLGLSNSPGFSNYFNPGKKQGSLTFI
jgi:hypothetical protein